MSELASTANAYADVVDLLRSVPEAKGNEETIAELAYTVRPQKPKLFALFVTSIGWTETNWGRVRDYINGRGDWILRTGHWLVEPGVITVNAVPAGTPWHLPRRTKDDPQGRWKRGDIIPGPYAMPEDGQGWGCWEMQEDWRHARIVGAKDRMACLLSCTRELDADLLTFPTRMDAAAAAYNAGVDAVRHALAQNIDPNEVTTGHDYAKRALGVFRQRAMLVAPDGSGDSLAV